MMQITVDVASLTQEQREHVSGFILTYPAVPPLVISPALMNQKVSGINEAGDKWSAKTSDDKNTSLTEAEVTAYDAVYEERSRIDHADNPATGLPEARDAFGDPVAQAFGSVTSPLPQGATAAPYTAGVAPSVTAPAVIPVITSNPPVNVPLPPAVNPAPAVPAPMAPVTPSSNHVNGVELDKDGLPYDARIHSAGKSKIANGTWKKRKQVDPALVAQVEAELRQLMGAPGPNVTAPPIIAPIATAAAAPVMAPAVSNGASQASDTTAQYMSLVGRASAAMAAGKLTENETNQICQMYGVPSLPLLLQRPDLIASVALQIDTIIASR